MVICLRSLQWSGGEVSLVGQGEKSVGGAENLTWNLKNLPSKLKFLGPRGPHGIPLLVRPLVR